MHFILLQVWDGITVDSINKLVSSFFQRLQLVILVKGECIQEYLRNNLCLSNSVLSPFNCSSELPISLIAGLEQGKDYEYDVPYDSETPLTDEE